MLVHILQIKEGIYGNALQHVRYFPPIDMVVGKEFFIRYTKENTKCNDRYRITWKGKFIFGTKSYYHIKGI